MSNWVRKERGQPHSNPVWYRAYRNVANWYTWLFEESGSGGWFAFGILAFLLMVAVIGGLVALLVVLILMAGWWAGAPAIAGALGLFGYAAVHSWHEAQQNLTQEQLRQSILRPSDPWR